MKNVAVLILKISLNTDSKQTLELLQTLTLVDHAIFSIVFVRKLGRTYGPPLSINKGL